MPALTMMISNTEYRKNGTGHDVKGEMFLLQDTWPRNLSYFLLLLLSFGVSS